MAPPCSPVKKSGGGGGEEEEKKRKKRKKEKISLIGEERKAFVCAYSVYFGVNVKVLICPIMFERICSVTVACQMCTCVLAFSLAYAEYLGKFLKHLMLTCDGNRNILHMVVACCKPPQNSPRAAKVIEGHKNRLRLKAADKKRRGKKSVSISWDSWRLQGTSLAKWNSECNTDYFD